MGPQRKETHALRRLSCAGELGWRKVRSMFGGCEGLWRPVTVEKPDCSWTRGPAAEIYGKVGVRAKVRIEWEALCSGRGVALGRPGD